MPLEFLIGPFAGLLRTIKHSVSDDKNADIAMRLLRATAWSAHTSGRPHTPANSIQQLGDQLAWATLDAWTLHLQHDDEIYRKLYVANVNAWLKYELINHLHAEDEEATEEPIEA